MSKTENRPNLTAAQALAALDQAWEYYVPGMPKTAPVNDYHPSAIAV